MILPVVLMLLLAVTRWPGLMPWNFSAVYALMFCAGVYFPKRLAWWLPLVTMLITDLLLNGLYYHVPLVGPEMAGNYLAYAALVLLGRQFSARSAWWKLLGGGLLGAIVFYLVTNTFAWFFNPYHNPEYIKNLAGWFVALTKGTGGYPQTWEFFRNTLMSGGLFTGLLAGAIKLMDAAEPAEEDAEAPVEEPQEKPEEAKA
jgi:uncharacterized protein DUF6580